MKDGMRGSGGEREGNGGTSLTVQGLRPGLPTQGMCVPALVWELRSHVPYGQNTSQNIKQEQYCNKF